MVQGRLAARILGGLALATVLAACQPPPPKPQDMAAARSVASEVVRQTLLGDQLDAIYRDSGANGMVIVVIDEAAHGTIAGFGHAGPGVGPPPDGRTVFRLQSVSKLFDCDLLSALVADGRMRLDDPLQRYAPAARTVPQPPGAPPITVLSLATHTSGLPREAIKPQKSAEAALTARWIWLAHQSDLPPAGTEASYSNIGFDLLGDAISAAAKTPYAAALQTTVTGPLGMNDTTPTPSADECARMMSPDPTRAPYPCRDQAWEAASGGLYSTGDDMARWLRAQVAPGAEADRRRISQATYVPRAPLKKAYGLDHAGPANAIGLAWIELLADGEHPRVLEKTGGGDGFLTYVVIDPAHHVGVFLAFDNLSGRRLPVMAREANALVGYLARMATPPAPAPAAPPAS
jgi:D-alanyl-D-alanine-carboxypeptidase/D-alanyl-D-alanine-endopeptidase